jgi:uncharacterized protein (UPF0218 family)
VDVVKNNQIVARLSAGRSFGELALVNDVYRNATIRAASHCRIWCIDRKTLRQSLSQTELHFKNEKIALLRNIPMFSKLSDDMFSQVADLLKIVEFVPNQRVIKQGDVSTPSIVCMSFYSHFLPLPYMLGG